MTLTEYIKAERGRGAALAVALGISPSQLSQIANDSSSTSPARCLAIENATDGEVTRKDLRADWLDIWPEMACPGWVCPCKKNSASGGASPNKGRE